MSEGRTFFSLLKEVFQKRWNFNLWFSGDTRWLELSLAHQNKDTVFGSKGETAIHRAAKKSNYQVIQRLLDHGFSPLAVGTGLKIV